MANGKAGHEFSPGCLCDGCLCVVDMHFRHIANQVVLALQDSRVLRKIVQDILEDYDGNPKYKPSSEQLTKRNVVMQAARVFLTNNSRNLEPLFRIS